MEYSTYTIILVLLTLLIACGINIYNMSEKNERMKERIEKIEKINKLIIEKQNNLKNEQDVYNFYIMMRDDPTTLPKRIPQLLKDIDDSDQKIKLLNKEIEELQAQLIKI